MNRRVAHGIALAKERKLEEALKTYTQALEIFPACVEALVARGAAYGSHFLLFYYSFLTGFFLFGARLDSFANKGQLTRAVSDFEAALKISPEDANANKYLALTKEKEAKLNAAVGSSFQSYRLCQI